MLGLVLHGTPRKFLQAVALAVPATAGILVQFPLYAAMAAILTKAEGRNGLTISEHLAEFFTNIGSGGGFAVVIALYTVVLGLFVPSGGGKWLVEAPYVMQSATDVGMNLGWTVQMYNVAEALPNLINPFFMLPLLAVLGLGRAIWWDSRSCSSCSTCRWSCSWCGCSERRSSSCPRCSRPHRDPDSRRP